MLQSQILTISNRGRYQFPSANPISKIRLETGRQGRRKEDDEKKSASLSHGPFQEMKKRKEEKEGERERKRERERERQGLCFSMAIKAES